MNAKRKIHRRHRPRGRGRGSPRCPTRARSTVVLGLAPRHPRADARDQARPTPRADAEISQDDTDLRRREEPADLRLRLFRPLHRPGAKIDIRSGLPALRQQWIEERGDTELLPDLTSEFGRQRAADKASTSCASPACTASRARQGRRQCQPDALRAPRHHHPRDGIRRHPREPATAAQYIESLKRQPASRARSWPTSCGRQHPGQNFGASNPGDDHPRVRARRDRPRPRHHPEQHQPPGSEPMIIGRNFLTKINANIGNSAPGLVHRQKKSTR
jgi:phosphomethylpyrimidine synthase